ncbi:hypothetical protein BDW72DRAFT_163450 [Aspergillus terricola var. indicus]
MGLGLLGINRHKTRTGCRRSRSSLLRGADPWPRPSTVSSWYMLEVVEMPSTLILSIENPEFLSVTKADCPISITQSPLQLKPHPLSSASHRAMLPTSASPRQTSLPLCPHRSTSATAISDSQAFWSASCQQSFLYRWWIERRVGWGRFRELLG